MNIVTSLIKIPCLDPKFSPVSGLSKLQNIDILSPPPPCTNISYCLVF